MCGLTLPSMQGCSRASPCTVTLPSLCRSSSAAAGVFKSLQVCRVSVLTLQPWNGSRIELTTLVTHHSDVSGAKPASAVEPPSAAFVDDTFAALKDSGLPAALADPSARDG